MKIHIDNHSRLDIAQAAQIVADLLRRERDFMLANTVGGCQFKTCGVTVAMYPTSKYHPAGEMAFLVTDADEKKGASNE